MRETNENSKTGGGLFSNNVNTVWMTPDDSTHEFVMNKVSRFKKSVLKKFLPFSIIITLTTLAKLVLFIVLGTGELGIFMFLPFMISGIAAVGTIRALATTERIFEDSGSVYRFLFFTALAFWSYLILMSKLIGLLIVSYALVMLFQYLSYSNLFNLFSAIKSKDYTSCSGLVTDVDDDVSIQHVRRGHPREFHQPFLMIAKTNSLNGPVDRSSGPIAKYLTSGKIDGIMSTKIYIDNFRYDFYDKGNTGYVLKINSSKICDMITFL